MIALFVCFLLINVSTAYAFSFSDIFDAINSFFDKIFGREKIGEPIIPPDTVCDCNNIIQCDVGEYCNTGSGVCIPYQGKTGLCVSLCGNGVINMGIGEECDGFNLNNKDCTNYIPNSPYIGGILSCNPDCTFNTQECDIQQYKLNVTKMGFGGGSVTLTPPGTTCGPTQINCIALYNLGESVELTASANSSSQFIGWSACEGSLCVITVNSDMTVFAYFVLPAQQYKLTVYKSGTGNGTITSNQGGINCGQICSAMYNSGSNVVLVPTPNTVSTFSGWTGCSYINGNTCMVTMSSNKSVTALFNAEICNDNIDNDNDGLVDCADPNCNNAVFVGSECEGGILKETNFTDDIDNDNDGVKDKLDIDCNLATGCNSLSISDIDVQGNENEFYQYSEIPLINCHYSTSIETSDSSSITECIDLNVSNIQCTNKQYFSDYIKFNDCYVGENLGSKDIKCSVDSKCKGYPNSKSYWINITEFPICNYNANVKGDVGIGNFSAFEIIFIVLILSTPRENKKPKG